MTDADNLDTRDTQENESSSEPILNLEEIAGLLQGSELSPKGTRILTDSNQLSYERLPMLEVVIDRLIRFLSTSLRNFTSGNVDISLQKIQSIRFGDYLNSVSLPTILGIFKIQEWSTMGLLTLDAPLIYKVIDVLLGGQSQSDLNLNEERSFTSIECSLIERLMKVILSDFEKSFEAIAPVHFTLERLEVNPHFAAIIRPANASVLSRLDLSIQGGGGMVEILLPYESIEPVRDKLLQMFMGEKFGEDTVWASHFSSEIWEASLDLEAILDTVTVPLKEVLAWQPGSQLSLRASADSTVSVICGNTPVFTGKMGQKSGHISIKLEQNFIRDKKAS